MQIEGRLTDLSDQELEALYRNAIYLSQDGTTVQKAAVEGLLPDISDEVSRRVKILQGRLQKQREEHRAILARVNERRRPNFS
jgi:hypothetical protein